MRETPRGERVGRETRVNYGDRARKLGGANVRIKPGQLIRTEHPFVNQSARRKARDVAITPALNFPKRRFDSLANNEQRYFEVRARIDIPVHTHCRDEYLAYHRTRASRWYRQHRIVDRNIAPAEHGASFLLYRSFDRSLAREASRSTSGEKQHANSVAARFRQ